ncbi:MAG: rhomboid family intramembrane serine protease [Taibaiella sp.]|nr:rhomboid family intramembrane serine protease [Taibaiella sp.]
MTFTIIIVAITVILSIAAFNNETIINKLILWPRQMDNPQEYYRLLTSGFIHADWNHLLFNMITLFYMGRWAEYILGAGFLTLYLSGIIIASLPSFLKNRNNSYYRSLGASGGVAAVLFFFIYSSPWSRINMMFIPIGIPSIIFGVLYLLFEAYMAKKGGGNVNHDAHIWGSVYGLFFALLSDPTHGLGFINALMSPQ